MSLPRLRSHLKMLAPCLRKFGNPDFLFKNTQTNIFLTRPRLVKIKIPFLNSAIGSQRKIQTGIWVVQKGIFGSKQPNRFLRRTLQVRARGRDTRPRAYAHIHTHGRNMHARARTRTRGETI